MADLSIVIPAFNETQRLPVYLKEIYAYLESLGLHYEIIVVDDGSTDDLPYALQYTTPHDGNMLVMRHPTNLGKGMAIATGARRANGNLLLYCDADGATPIEEERQLRQAIASGADVAIGSRFGRYRAKGCSRRWCRWFAGAFFGYAVRHMLGLRYRDTQCGFKMFRRSAAIALFSLSRQPGYLLDAELLWWADKLSMTVVEVPVVWRERSGGHNHILKDGVQMLSGLYGLRREMHSTAHKMSGMSVRPRTSQQI